MLTGSMTITRGDDYYNADGRAFIFASPIGYGVPDLTDGLASGADGSNPLMTTTAASFVIPAVGSTVSVQVVTGSWIEVGQQVVVSDANVGGGHQGTFMVTANSSGMLTLLLISLAAGAPSSAMGAGAVVMPPQIGSTIVAVLFNMPAYGSSVTATLSNAAWIQAGQILNVSDFTNGGSSIMQFLVTAVAGNSVTMTRVTLITGSAPSQEGTGTAVVPVNFLTPASQALEVVAEFFTPTGSSPVLTVDCSVGNAGTGSQQVVLEMSSTQTTALAGATYLVAIKATLNNGHTVTFYDVTCTVQSSQG